MGGFRRETNHIVSSVQVEEIWIVRHAILQLLFSPWVGGFTGLHRGLRCLWIKLPLCCIHVPCWCLGKRAPTHQLNPRRPQINPVERAASVRSKLFAFNFHRIQCRAAEYECQTSCDIKPARGVTYIRRWTTKETKRWAKITAVSLYAAGRNWRKCCQSSNSAKNSCFYQLPSISFF